MSEKMVRANDVLKVRKELDKRKSLEEALRTFLAVELTETTPRRQETIKDAVNKFFQGKLKIWYSHGWLTFTESTEGAFKS